MKFEELKIKPAILDGIKKAQYNEMTDIQKQVIPIALEGLDIIGQAPTGTGKTCAFVVPTLEQIDFDDHQIQILVMCPTRELAMQITTEYQKIGAFLNGLKVLTIYGGQKINQQFAQLKRQPQIVVCTTGRILDHLHRKTVNLNHVKTIILDEADEMLDMGFSRDIDNVLAKSNSKHQTILLSATIDKTILDISKKYQKQPNFVKATIALKDIPTISQYYIRTPEFKKVDVIIKLIKEKKLYLVLIFTSTRKKTKWLTYKLAEHGLTVKGLHSDLRQSVRDRVMQSFRQGKIQVLVATDIAARGIDVKGVDAVINYDVPRDMKYYVHRIGRTARAQAIGNAYTLISHDLSNNLRTIEKQIHEPLVEYKMSGINFDEQTFEQPRNSFDHKPSKGAHRFNNKEHVMKQDNYLSKKSSGTSTRFFITIGKKDQIDNDSLKWALVKDKNIPLKDIFDVWVKDTYSFVEIKNDSKDVLTNISEIKGHNIKIQVANPKKPSFANKNRNPRNRFQNKNKWQHRQRFDK